MTARETSPKPAEDKASLLEKGAAPTPPPPAPGAKQLLFCFIGLQASYLTWGYVQEKVMTKEYSTSAIKDAFHPHFPYHPRQGIMFGIMQGGF